MFPPLQVTLDNQHLPEFQRELARFNFNDDCPVFDGMFDYCR
jgi:histone deacetylase 1/2